VAQYEKELEIALLAAERAGNFLRSAYEAFSPISDAPASISTEADRTSQEMILTDLAAAFPNDALCAEEATATLQSSRRDGPRMWIVDPIDGTRGFVTKNGEFSAMIGLVVEEQVVVGVVLEPAVNRVTFARLGGGCWSRSKKNASSPVYVSRAATLMSAALVQSHAKPGQTPWPVQALQPHRIVETYSAGVKMAMVARGEVDLYVNTYANFSDWDICAGHVLITEAGGSVSEISGMPIRYRQPGNAQRGGLLASNGILHAAAVSALAGSDC
jgi:3'(2'), 5'-bisphosphate nucleotidase